MQMTYPTPTPTTFDFNATDIQGHILSDVTMPRPDGTAVILRALELWGSREGLAITAAANGAWEIWHINSGCCLHRAEGLRGLTTLLTAMGRTFSFNANWQVQHVSELNAYALGSLRELRQYFA